MDHFDLAVATPQISGAALTGVNTLTAKDSGGNTITAFNASANNVTMTSTPSDGTITGLGSGSNNVLNQAGDFTNGTANLTSLGMKFTGTAGDHTFTAASGGKTGVSGTVTINAGTTAKILVETAPDGSGTVVPLQSIAQGAAVTGYAIARDASNNFIENTAADTWNLPTKTGGVVDGDLVAAGDNKSAVFTGHDAGTGVIHAAKTGFVSTDSGTLTVGTVPTVISTVYAQASRKLTITFNENMDIATFTAATLGNLSIQDQLVNTVTLSGATIITTASSTVMEATLTVSEDNALYAIRANALRLVAVASCGIKDLAAQELAQNTYATSIYAVTYNAAAATPITGTLTDSKSGLIIANAAIKFYDSAGNLRAETTSDTSGNFSFNVNVPSGDYTLNITKLPVFKNKEQAITIIAGVAEAAGDVLIDPFGIVYDSVTGEAIAGANVILYTASGNIYTGSPQPNPQSSMANGGYNFDVEPGQYYLTAAKDGYANYTGAVFLVTTEIVEWNIPMIPNNQMTSAYLYISKQANKKVAVIGDIITYTVSMRNIDSAANAADVTLIDTLPQGFQYVKDSTRIDGSPGGNPDGARILRWSLGTLNTLTTKKITYRVRVGPDARVRNNKNSAVVSATVLGSSTSAGPSVAIVEIMEGLFSDRGIIIGKVFEDKNDNGIQDPDEPGIPSVSLIMEDGKAIITDEYGRYSVPNIEKGTHVIRLDQRVLPGGPFCKGAVPPEGAGRGEAAPEAGKEEPQESGGRGHLNVPCDDDESSNLPCQEKDREPIIDRRQLDTWRRESLDYKEEDKKPKETGVPVNKDKSSDKDTQKRKPYDELLKKYGDPKTKENSPLGAYRPDIPKESKFFKIYGSETAKVNFPVKLLPEEEAEKEAEKDKKPNQFMLVGLVDGTIGYLDAAGNIKDLGSGVNAPLKDDLYLDGKIKLYFKGLVKGEYLLTAALDTEKKKSDHLFEYVNPEKYYPIYGDSSAYFNETDSKTKFYVRIDKDSSCGMFGNYNTQEFTKNELTRYNRMLNGIRVHADSRDFIKSESKQNSIQTDFFYAKSNQEQTSETFSAKGISGPFYLNRTPIVEYTESIRVETRDIERPDIILYTKTFIRDVDYEIDFDTGRIMFKEPISTYDENNDPNHIVVDYEYVPLSGENKYYTTGTRVETKLFKDTLTLGTQIVTETHPDNNPRLFGLDLVYEPDSATRVSAEYGSSGGMMDDTVSIDTGRAWKAELSKTLGNLSLQAYYADIGNRFRNPVNVTEKGVEKYGATAQYRFDNYTSVVLDNWQNKSTISDTLNRETKLDLYHNKDRYFLNAGYAFQQYKDEHHLTANKDTNVVNLKGGLKLMDNLIVSLEEQLKHVDQTKVNPVDNQVYTTTGRIDYKVSEDTTIYAKHRYVDEQHKKYSNITGVGISKRTADGDAYVEYGFGGEGADTVFGLKRELNLNERLTLSSYMNNHITADKNDENVGFGTKYEMVEGLFTTLNFENTRARATATSLYKQNAQSVALDYLPPSTKNSYGVKFEHRKALDTTEENIGGYARHDLNKEWSLIFDSEYLKERSAESSERCNRKAIAGLAYRPIKIDKLNLLSKYEYKDELNHTSAISSTDYYDHIASLEGSCELTQRADLFGKYALKYHKEKDNLLKTGALVDMVTTKLTYKLTKYLDIAGYYRIINDRDSEIIKQGSAVETGITLFKSIRFGLGYNFLDYKDRDSSADEYQGAGPYFNVSAKM